MTSAFDCYDGLTHAGFMDDVLQDPNFMAYGCPAAQPQPSQSLSPCSASNGGVEASITRLPAVGCTVSVTSARPMMPPAQLIKHGSNASLDAAAPAGNKNGTISHSAIEKHRRDRLNQLIDELRELVPTQAGPKGSEGALDPSGKRPKHMVLQETIRLIRGLHNEAAMRTHEIHQLRLQLQLQQQQQANITASCQAPASQQNAGPAAQVPPTDPNSLQLPKAPANAPASVGVLVEEGEASYTVRVHCKDRRGLLSDITAALQELPLRITRASITTSDAGAVADVFELAYEPGDGGLQGSQQVDAMSLQLQLQAALYRRRSGGGAAGWVAAGGGCAAASAEGAAAGSKRQRSDAFWVSH